MRSQLNRIVLLATLMVVLPVIAVIERLHRGSGRVFAVSAIRRVGWLCGISFEVGGAGSLDVDMSYVLVPNHTSLVDIAAVLVACPDARFVAASGLFRVPLLGTAMRALGAIPIRRNDPARSRARVDELSRFEGRRRLVMFPEGRIARTDTVEPFKTGAFVVAVRSNVPVVPVAIRGASRVLRRGGRLRLQPGTVHIDILAPISTDGLSLDDRQELADTARNRVVAALSH